MTFATEPRQAVAFIDGQNLYHSARETFGHTFPNYDVAALAEAVCRQNGWNLRQVRFYTGVPDAADDAVWHRFWAAKLAQMGRKKVHVFTRSLRYRKRVVRLPDGAERTFTSAEEKGIDVRLALDVIRLAHRREYDVAILFSQDQDLSEAADELRVIAAEQNRWIKAASAYPSGPEARSRRGINGTDWIRIDRATYDACLDRRDYRAKRHDPEGGGAAAPSPPHPVTPTIH